MTVALAVLMVALLMAFIVAVALVVALVAVHVVVPVSQGQAPRRVRAFLAAVASMSDRQAA